LRALARGVALNRRLTALSGGVNPVVRDKGLGQAAALNGGSFRHTIWPTGLRILKKALTLEPSPKWINSEFILDFNVASEKSASQFKIDDCIASFPENVQHTLKELRTATKEAAPEAKKTMSYGMLTFKLKGNPAHFAAYKKHIGFYPTSTGIEAFRKELAPYKWAKGSVQFPLDKPIPYDLVERIVAFRVRENLKNKESHKEK